VDYGIVARIRRSTPMPSAADAAAILSRFPGPVTLYPSRKKWLLVLAGSALFAVGGFWMIRQGNAMGWVVLIFFGLVAVVAAAAMLPGAGGLTLDRDGFEATNLFRRHRTRWQDATGFQAARIPPAHQNWVAYDDVNASTKRIAKFNVGIVGRNVALPDTYGLSADNLAQLMVQWRERALAPSVRR
jgi:hypothetical protein